MSAQTTAATPHTAISMFVQTYETDARALRDRIAYTLDRLVRDTAEIRDRFNAVDVDARTMDHLSCTPAMNVVNNAAEVATLIRQLDTTLAAIKEIEHNRKAEEGFGSR